jgi:hypothetical protein
VSTNSPKTGDATNLTAYVSKDDGAVTVLGDTSATELDATNAPGLYSFDLTQAETNADKALFTGKSSTANVKLIPLLVYTLPASFTSHVAQTGDSYAIVNSGTHGNAALKTLVDDLPTNAELAAADDATLAAIAALNNLSSAQVETVLLTVLTTAVADSVPADGARPSIAQAAYITTQYLLDRAVSGTTMTVRKPDGNTALLTLTLNDATSPTSVTRAT